MARLALLWLCLVTASCAQRVTSPSPDAEADADRDPPALDAESSADAQPDAGLTDGAAEDAACAPMCGPRRCGLDPVCGTSCGECSGTQACSTQGECIETCTVGQSTCGVDGVSYRGCGFDELLGVPNLGPRVACVGGGRCDDGRCSGGSCVPAQLMLVVDRSASTSANNVWSWVRDEVVTVVNSHQNDNAIGLRQFPDGQCMPGAVLTPMRESRVALEAALMPPTADASSPIADALAGLAPHLSGQDDGRAVVLITDGDETCRSASDASRAASVLLRAGVRTYALGLGAANRTFLDDIALAGGTGTSRAITDATSLRDALGAVMADVGACRNARAQVSLGWYHSCAIRANGRLACWGRTQDNRHVPPTGRFIHLGTSTDAACAVAQDGRIRCWGRDLYGQLLAPTTGSFVEVVGGNAHFCGRRGDGAVQCWGDDRDRQTMPPSTSFKQITATAFGSCGIQVDDRIDCWGQASPLTGTYRQIDGGSFSMCGVTTAGAIVCTGMGTPPAGNFTQVSNGDNTACALRSDGTIACWGSDVYDLVTGAPAGRFVDVDVEYMTACAVRESDDGVVCWGYDGEGMAQPPP